MAAWFWNGNLQQVVKAKKNAYKVWQDTKSLAALNDYKSKKKAAKAAAAKAKNAALDELYKKLDTSQAEKFVFRLAKARHRNSLHVIRKNS
ncbi:hypothetical protein Y032_0092g2587 [Ancylostoma ceylanicum]|uniref:Uncharacterized protein n=1 Tax=Ancylostoma ceylanicum TaxID=53326 RepID=A0A016TM32_9BILA|nr:hypothetical protein Y032_0092g2587 [Ancylostoma ceylanicum]